MSPEYRDLLVALIAALRAQSTTLIEVAKKVPKLDPAYVSQLEQVQYELHAMGPPASSQAAKAREARSLELRPYLVEYAGEEARQLSYRDLSELLGLSEASIRVRISQSFHKGFIRTVRGRPVVVLRDPANLQKVLNEKFAQTQHPDDQVVLPKRPPKSR